MSSWLERAMCAVERIDPVEFDTPPGYNNCLNYSPIEEQREAVDWGRVCDGCPVARECARDALEHDNYGVIRAGIPLAEKTGPHPAVKKYPLRALQYVASGVSPLAARAVLVDICDKNRKTRYPGGTKRKGGKR